MGICSRAVLGFLAAIGRTALWDAMDSALQVIHSAPHSSKVLILITDIGNNNSHLTLKELRDIARESEARIYLMRHWLLGFCLGCDTDDVSPRFSRLECCPARFHCLGNLFLLCGAHCLAFIGCEARSSSSGGRTLQGRCPLCAADALPEIREFLI